MAAYVLKRLLQGVPTLLGVTLATFLLFNVFGGDPVLTFLGKNATAEQIDAMRREFGFDQPLWRQYLHYLQEIVTLDFGRSFQTREDVTGLIVERAGVSLSLTLPALLITTLLAVSIGLLAAAFRGRRLDRLLMFFAVAGMSISFLVYIVVGQYLLAFLLPLFHIHGYEGGALERWQYLALPILILVVVGLGYDTRYYRTVMVEEVGRDYVTTARAKGVGQGRILFVHVLKNALIPIISRVMISVPFLITGSLLLETFFGIPGLGNKILAAINESDLPVIKAITVLVALLFILFNILTDLLYSWADPRVRLK